MVQVIFARPLMAAASPSDQIKARLSSVKETAFPTGPCNPCFSQSLVSRRKLQPPGLVGRFRRKRRGGPGGRGAEAGWPGEPSLPVYRQNRQYRRFPAMGRGPGKTKLETTSRNWACQEEMAAECCGSKGNGEGVAVGGNGKGVTIRADCHPFDRQRHRSKGPVPLRLKNAYIPPAL